MRTAAAPQPQKRTRRVLLALLCVSVISTRVEAAHLHLCLDGKEAPATVRTSPDPIRDAGSQAPHNDRDVALASDLIGKQSKDTSKQPVALPTGRMPTVAFTASIAAPAAPTPRVPALSLVTPPPIRGPPGSPTV